MASRELVNILKGGASAWNDWRRKDPGIRADLTDADLGKARLSEVDLRNADLTGANLSGTLLTLTDLSGADLTRASLNNGQLIETNLTGATLIDADLNRAYCRDADFRGADLTGAEVKDAYIRDVNLTDAQLVETDLRDSYLREVNLTKALLVETNLSGATLIDVKLKDANLAKAKLGWTVLAGVDLSEAKGLKTVKHCGPSTIGIDTLFRSRGRIPEEFLRGSGIPENCVAHVGLIVGEPVHYHSCFLSYAHPDHLFVEKLHKDLEGKNVRCWTIPDGEILGEKIRDRINESTRAEDRLLMVLSRNSLSSNWIRQGVETAIANERSVAHPVLIPLLLDDAVMFTEDGWPPLLQQTRWLVDFRRWREKGSYTRALNLLLRYLAGGEDAPLPHLRGPHQYELFKGR